MHEHSCLHYSMAVWRQLAGSHRCSRAKFSAETASCWRRTLNRIQSKIFPTAFGSNENVLVCAPTGAGKTNIAMMSVLHEIGANMQDGMIQVRRMSHTGGIGWPMLMQKPRCCLSGFFNHTTHETCSPWGNTADLNHMRRNRAAEQLQDCVRGAHESIGRGGHSRLLSSPRTSWCAGAHTSFGLLQPALSPKTLLA